MQTELRKKRTSWFSSYCLHFYCYFALETKKRRPKRTYRGREREQRQQQPHLMYSPLRQVHPLARSFKSRISATLAPLTQAFRTKQETLVFPTSFFVEARPALLLVSCRACSNNRYQGTWYYIAHIVRLLRNASPLVPVLLSAPIDLLPDLSRALALLPVASHLPLEQSHPPSSKKGNDLQIEYE